MTGRKTRPVRARSALTAISGAQQLPSCCRLVRALRRMCRVSGKEAVYPQFFLQLGEEPPAFVVSSLPPSSVTMTARSR